MHEQEPIIVPAGSLSPELREKLRMATIESEEAYAAEVAEREAARVSPDAPPEA